MKSSARVFALVCLMGLPLSGCTHGSTGQGESFLYHSSRTEIGIGRRNSEDSNDASSKDVVTIPALDDVFRVPDGDEGSRS